MILATAPVSNLLALQDTLQQFINSLPRGVHPAEVVVDVQPDTLICLKKITLTDNSAAYNVEFTD